MAPQLVHLLQEWEGVTLSPRFRAGPQVVQEINSVWALMPPPPDTPAWLTERKKIGDRAEMYSLQFERTQSDPASIIWVARDTDYHQLTHWSEKLGEIDVVLDDSAPLRLVKTLFDGFVGKREGAYIEFRGVRHPYTFSLKRPVTLMDSKLSAGIQLADVVASTAAYGYSQAIRGKIGEQERKWLALLLTGTDQTVWPDASRFSSRSSEGFAGKFVLTELVRRSIEKQDLYDGLPEALRAAMWKRAMSRLKKRLERRAASR
jgi:hypothetical protein